MSYPRIGKKRPEARAIEVMTVVMTRRLCLTAKKNNIASKPTKNIIGKDIIVASIAYTHEQIIPLIPYPTHHNGNIYINIIKLKI